jgi:hypothetical protein
MARTRLIVLIALAVAAALFLARSRAAGPPVVPGSVHFAPVNHHRLQADEEGYYLPLAEFTVGGFQFNGFSLHPDAMVIFARVADSIQHPSAPCQGALIRPDTVHLVCPYPGLGTVTVDGVFPVRETEDTSSGPRFVGFVTVSADGRILYRKRHPFSFTIGE